MLNSSTVQLIEYLFALNRTSVNVDDVCSDLSWGRRTLYYNVHKLNEALEGRSLGTVKLCGGCLSLTEDFEHSVRRDIFTDNPMYVFSSTERKILICIAAGITVRPVTIEYLIRLLDVSRNTVLSEISDLREIMRLKEIMFKSHNKGGYYLDGDEIMVRNALLECLNAAGNDTMLRIVEDILTERLAEKADWKGEPHDFLAAVQQAVSSIEYYAGGQFSTSALREITYYLCLTYLRQDKKSASIADSDVDGKPEYQAAQATIKRLNELEIYISESETRYIAIVYMGARIQCFNAAFGNREPVLAEFAEDLFRVFEQKAMVEFKDRQRLKEQLIIHLRPMYYRLKYSIRADNQFSQVIISQYRDLYNLTDLTVKTVEGRYGFCIPDDEIAYLAIFFGSFIKYQGKPAEDLKGKVLIVCGAGISSAMLIRQQLIFLLGSGCQYEICDKRHVTADKLNGYFLIVSAVKLPFNSQKIIYVNAVLSLPQKEKLLLYSLKNEPDSVNAASVSDLIKIVDRHARITDRTGLVNDLRQYLAGEYLTGDKLELKDVFKRSYVQYGRNNGGWKQAIHEACRPLVDRGIIADGYGNDIIDLIEELGLYSEYLPGILLAHAKPGRYVHSIGIALTVFDRPIVFDKWNGRIKAVFVLATINNEAHFKALQTLMEVLTDEGVRTRIETLNGSQDSLDEIYGYFVKETE